ncbi:glycosyltransferase family 4 protein [bacterium]|nr:glycosyltransferase family 4 protein [bacterium]
MHIGFIEDTHLHGGTQIWVSEAAKIFINKGEDVTVIAPLDSWVANECSKAGARIIAYDWDKVVTKSDESRNIWIKGLNSCDVAVCTVHPPRNDFHCSVFGAECIKQAGLDTVLIPKTGTIVPEYLREFYLPDDSINVRVISITDFTRKYLIDNYKIPAEKVELIYQGTEVDRFTSSDKNKAEAFRRYPLCDTASPVLGSVGSFEERKGQVILLNAVAKLAAGSIPNIHLILVGDGPDEEMLKAKVKTLNIEKNVTFFPFTNEPNYIFERIDILALPSLYKEGLPNVLLEAMSMGLPVISSKLAGVPEVVFNGKTGYMTKPGDQNELVDAIVKLSLNKDAYLGMGKNARKLMEKKFDKRVQFNEFLKFFHKITGK